MRQKTPRRYYAYVLRCWLEESRTQGTQTSWRFSLERVLHQRTRRGFGSLEAMVSFLQAELDAVETDGSCESEP